MVKTIKNRAQKFSPLPITPWFKWHLMTLVILLMLPLLSVAKSLEVSADRQTIEMGDILTLTIKADFKTRGSQLDLGSLKDQFEILSLQQSNQISIINGQFNSNTQWHVTLFAKQEGELIVPPLRIDGAESQPYKIKVLPAQKKSATSMGNYFLESSLNKQQVYVQEEVLYSLKLYFLGTLQGSIRPPMFDHSLTVTLKDQAAYGKRVNGKNYTVYEWLYAVHPQQSGELVITGPVFSGIHQYHNRQKGIQEVAETQTLNVLPEPVHLKSNPNDSWLPAKSLRLSETNQNQPTPIRVGDSLTRTLTLKVTGLRASQLPSLSMANQTGFKVYSDQPVTTENILDNGVQSQQQLKQTIIFTQEGTITLPEQRIEWFNTQTQKMETATIKAQSFTVLPALNAPSSNQNASTNQTTPHSQPYAQPETDTTEHASRETTLLWPVISTLLSLAWLITLVLWRKQVKKLKHQQQENAKQTDNPTLKTPPKNTLCDSKSTLTPHAFYNELRTVLQQEHDIHSFSELNDNALIQAINQLEKHLFYQADLADTTLPTICEGLKKLTNKNSPPPSHKESKLASLYKTT